MQHHHYDFKHVCLYEQKARLDEAKTLLSKVYAASYVFPGALTPTSVRCRTSLVYEDNNSEVIVSGGTIEKWSDKGWQVVEEFFDACVEFDEEEEASNYLLQLFKSFITGIPVRSNNRVEPEPPTSSTGNEPKLRVLSFKDKYKETIEDLESDNNTPSKPEKNKGDDFDWI